MSRRFHIDFEKWSDLANSNPEAFERKRQTTVDHFICSFPEKRQQNLRQLQWRIDGVRRTTSTPMAACIKISSMMMDSVYGDGGLLELLQATTTPGRPLQPVTASVAVSTNILPFPLVKPPN